jgi:GTPase Era involved in 16S rRNA processing
MGQKSSSFMDAEKKSWEFHELQICDETKSQQWLLWMSRKEYITKMSLCRMKNSAVVIDYYHYFVLFSCNTPTGNRKLVLEFGGGELSNASVLLHENPKSNYEVVKAVYETADIASVEFRVQQILGASSYSVVLRNCEHLSNFVMSGVWYSSQTMPDDKNCGIRGVMDKLSKAARGKINSMPHGIKANNAGFEDIVLEYKSRIEGPATAASYNDKDYVVAFVGPSRSGKSYLINTLAQEAVVRSGFGLDSVTADVSMTARSVRTTNHVKGADGQRQAINTVRNCRFLDTVGLGDSKISLDNLVPLIKYRLKNQINKIDVVVMVVNGQAGLSAEVRRAMKSIMDWLDYENNKNQFVFVLTKLSTSDDSALAEEQLRSAFGIRDTTFVRADGKKKKLKAITAIDLKPRNDEDYKIMQQRMQDLSEIIFAEGNSITLNELSCYDTLKSALLN